jgi:capsular polysaccharide transport system ATP-binding protein
MIVFENVSQEYPTPKGVRTVLDNLSFALPERCKLGILGLNGAGKSTLVNLISGAQLPARGRIIRTSRISWPLGFAGGFNGSLSGIENCLFAARIYGQDERKIIDYVTEFSELGQHLQLPVKAYSSGMRARLSFGLSLAFDFDYYLIDEVIAVGDARFRVKCKTALETKLKHAGIVLVSHAMSTIQEYCTSLALVHDRKVQFFDDMEEGFKAYSALTGQPYEPRKEADMLTDGGDASFTDNNIAAMVINDDASAFS